MNDLLKTDAFTRIKKVSLPGCRKLNPRLFKNGEMQGAKKVQGRSVLRVREGLNFLQHNKVIRSCTAQKLAYNSLNAADRRFSTAWGVMEPVRREGSLGRKFHGNKRALDWWTVEKPLDWDPVEAGRKVSLNHDYGRPDQPADKRAAKPATPPAPAGEQPAGPARTLLAMGAQAAKESGADKGQSAPQSAEDLKQWERGQGIDPNQGSGHENRPPSSSRDAAQMGKAEQVRNLKEYAGWIHTMKNNPPWADKAKTPAQKVQGVTHPLGESVGGELLEQMLKGGSKGARVLG